MFTHELRWSADARRLPVQAAVVAMGAIALAGCNGSRNAYVPPPPPKVVVAQPIEKPVTLYLELTGNTQAFNSVDLVARVQGYLESIDYKDGAFVTKGTQLFGIERDNYQQQLDQANASLAANRGDARVQQGRIRATSRRSPGKISPASRFRSNGRPIRIWRRRRC